MNVREKVEGVNAKKRNKLSKKGSSEKDQVRERVPRVPRVSRQILGSVKATKRHGKSKTEREKKR